MKCIVMDDSVPSDKKILEMRNRRRMKIGAEKYERRSL
jgi:hypothetical protein